MSDTYDGNPGFVPDGEAGGDGPEVPFEVPDDPASLIDMESPVDAPVEDAPPSPVAGLERLVAERTADLQRLQAEYANYKKRVDRDRDVARARGIEAVVVDLLPVLDGIEAARQHGEQSVGFRLVADELDKIAKKHGLVVYGEVGEPFDPTLHEALMQVPYDGDIDTTTVSAVIQKGVKLNDRVIRPARVGVAEPT